jgi:hypothetical protein
VRKINLAGCSVNGIRRNCLCKIVDECGKKEKDSRAENAKNTPESTENREEIEERENLIAHGKRKVQNFSSATRKDRAHKKLLK